MNDTHLPAAKVESLPKCEGCGSAGQVRVNLLNGGLCLCRQCLAEFNGKNPELKRLQAAIREHRDQRGDDRCWMDDEKLYAALPEGYAPPARDSRVELALCEKYIACRRNPATEYVSPQRRIEELEAALLPFAKNWLAVAHDADAVLAATPGNDLFSEAVANFRRAAEVLGLTPTGRAMTCPQCAALTDTLAHDPAKGWKCPKCSQGG